MPEYFDISFITKKHDPRNSIKVFQETFNLYEGRNNVKENDYALLAHKEIIFNYYQDYPADFEEFCVSISNQLFCKEQFEKELEKIAHFIEKCFAINTSIRFALCSYEINSYYLSKVHRIDDFDLRFLSQFPIVYTNKDKTIEVEIHTEAQDIFTMTPIVFFTKPKVCIKNILGILEEIKNKPSYHPRFPKIPALLDEIESERIKNIVVPKLVELEQEINNLILQVSYCPTIQEADVYFDLLDDIQMVLASLIYNEDIETSDRLRQFVNDFDNLEFYKEYYFEKITNDEYSL